VDALQLQSKSTSLSSLGGLFATNFYSSTDPVIFNIDVDSKLKINKNSIKQTSRENLSPKIEHKGCQKQQLLS